MPISPERMKTYPGGSIRSPEWLAIRKRILQRSGNCCELCGVENYKLGGRTESGTFLEAWAVEERMATLVWPKPGQHWWCGPRPGQWLRIVRIVLTIMHLNHNPADSDDFNLKAACQRCHLIYDARHHAENAARTRRRKSPQADLLEG